MKHLGTKTLETRRLILRQYRMEDAEVMYRNWANDERVVRYLTWPVHADTEVSRKVTQMWVDSYAQENYYQWAIELKEIGEIIGSISGVHQNDEIEEVELGYCIGHAWWGNGYMAEALQEVIRFMFEEVGMNRIKAIHDVENVNSGKVMRKAGMKKEGVLRQAARNNRGLIDIAVYAILREVYNKDEKERV